MKGSRKSDEAEATTMLPKLKLPLPLSSVATAVLVGGSIVAAAGIPPLPGLGLLGFLVLIVEEDVRRRRISNRLTFPALGAALGLAAGTAGGPGLVFALSGALLGLAVLVLPFALRWIGAGDVKAVMVLGAFAGPLLTLELLYWITLAGGAIALAILALRGGLGELLLRWSIAARLCLASRSFFAAAPQPGSAAASSLPFAVAIGFGVAACELWGSGCLS